MDYIRVQRATQRSGDWTNYQANLNAWGYSYEQEWQNWLITLAGGITDPTEPPTEPTTEVLLDTSVSASACAWN